MKTGSGKYRTIGFCALMFAYCPIGIVFPVYLLNVNYAVSTLFLFWVPTAIMFALNLSWLIRRNLLLPFLTTSVLLAVVAFYFEYAALGIGVWYFSEEHHLLLRSIFKTSSFPYAVYGAPIEEFLFWFGATPFCILLYCCFYRLIHHDTGLSHELLLTAAWPVMLVPFLPLVGWLHHNLKRKRIVCLQALQLTVLFFCVTMVFIEYNALMHGHWVYNSQRIMGFKIFRVIPGEELFYYIFGPVFVILLFHFIGLRPKVVLAGSNKYNDVSNLTRIIVRTARAVWGVVRPLHAKTLLSSGFPPLTVGINTGSSSEWENNAPIRLLESAISQHRFYDAHLLVDELISYLREPNQKITVSASGSVLSLMRNYAWFEPLYKLSSTLRAGGRNEPEVRRHLAQALIEQGHHTEAIEELRLLRGELEAHLSGIEALDGPILSELGETIGLLGRSYKQLYINANPRSIEPRLQDLEMSIEHYRNAFHRRTGDYLWHGVNYIALTTHAVRIQRNDPSVFSADAQRQAIFILDELLHQESIGPLQPWNLANRIECYLALGKYDKAIGATLDYLHHDDINAFIVQSTRRQLVELWGLHEATSPGREILPMMTACFAEQGGLHEEIVLLPEKYGDYEELFETTQFLSIRFLLNALNATKSVGRIGPNRNTTWGTGFLFNAAWLSDCGTTRNLFLTNAHICSSSPEVQRCFPQSVAPENYWVLFSDFSGREGYGVPVKVHRELWTSPPSELDATLLEIAPPPSGFHPPQDFASLSLPMVPVGRVAVIGHPKGFNLHVSMQNNELVGLKGHNIFYQTPTDAGSSGSPVFDRSWNVVALHQGTLPEKNTNVGIRIDTIIEAIKKHLTTG